MKKINKSYDQPQRWWMQIVLMRKSVFFFLVISSFLSSCKIQQYNFIGGKWQQEEKEHTLENKDKGCRFVYNLDELNYMLPQNILLTQEMISLTGKESHPDKFCRSILKKVNYNQDTDSIYFILQGYLIVFSSPEFSLPTATSYIDLTRIVKGDYPNPSIDWYTEETVMDHYIYRTISCSSKKKQYLVKDVFRWKGEYINMVHIFQSRTKANKNIYPRVWRTSYDVTDPVHVIYVGRMLSKYNRLSIMNALGNR